MSAGELTARFEAAMREPELILTVESAWSLGDGMVTAVRFAKPGATSRSKPVELCPMLVGKRDEPAADLLEQIAALMRQAGRST